jgi:NAD(P)-dependent dehydrogenase (short-subunit alcohol dehydrogenase family)
MKNKTIMITGANSGIGKATALGLAKMGANVVMVCRNRDRGKAAQAEIMDASGNQSVDLLLADFSSQQSIRQLVETFKNSYQELHVLVNNAGVWQQNRNMTPDGFEMHFAVNHLGYFLLTNLLLNVLKASAPARIVSVASSLHGSGRIDFDDLQTEKHFNGNAAYSNSKLANVLLTYELARRLDGSAVTANCLHPGIIKSGLQRDLSWFIRFVRLFYISPKEGAATPIYLASSPEVEGVTGKYFVKRCEQRSSAASYDETVARRLWQVSEQMTGLAEFGSGENYAQE